MAAGRLGSDYRRFWTGAALSNLGDGIRLGALPLLALELTDSATLVAGVVAVTMLPWMLVGPFGGVVVDRSDRARLMVWGQALRGALAAGFAVVVVADLANVALLYVVAFGLGVGEVFVDSASQAAVPQLVDDEVLERANARLATAQLVFDRMIGAAIGSLLFVATPWLPFAVDAVTFLAGAVAVSTIRRSLRPIDDRDATADDRGAWARLGHDLREGFRFLWGH